MQVYKGEGKIHISLLYIELKTNDLGLVSWGFHPALFWKGFRFPQWDVEAPSLLSLQPFAGSVQLCPTAIAVGEFELGDILASNTQIPAQLKVLQIAWEWKITFNGLEKIVTITLKKKSKYYSIYIRAACSIHYTFTCLKEIGTGVFKYFISYYKYRSWSFHAFPAKSCFKKKKKSLQLQSHFFS